MSEPTRIRAEREPTSMGRATEAGSGVRPRPVMLPAEVFRAKYAPELLGDDPRLIDVLRVMACVADTDCTVLVTGESGTGKELVARGLHAASARAQRPFIAVSCAAIPESLVESELFGHARGAFTGAIASREGFFAAADGGTLLLDEIGELPLPAQAKLLRVLQQREIGVVGETRPRRVDVRVVCATHRDLAAMVAAGTFREDLLYRIHVVPIELPPLRERASDIPEIVAHFLEQVRDRKRRAVTGFTPDALEALCSYSWPGNIRQLQHTIERLVVMKRAGEIGRCDLPTSILGARSKPAPAASFCEVLPEGGLDLRDAVERFESNLILQALDRTGWNKSRAAAVLRLNRTTLVEKLRKKDLSPTQGNRIKTSRI